MNLRGKFTTDEDGHISFRSVKPAGYPIPIDGPVGELLRAQGRHNMRPAHLHFLVYKPGFKTLISQIYDPEDKNIETDVQFGVTRHLIGNYVRHDEAVPARRRREGAVVFARAHLRHGKRHGASAAAADHRQGAKASGRKFRISKRYDVCSSLHKRTENKQKGRNMMMRRTLLKGMAATAASGIARPSRGRRQRPQNRHQHADHRRRL